eukprot:scaffold108662_cov38-Phaeocystis_antarctica.AAC.1
MLQHILKKNLLLITASASEAGPGFRAGPASASEHHLRAATRYGRMLPIAEPPGPEERPPKHRVTTSAGCSA